ncbi:MAG: hypothetical protein G01um10145_541 [Microgenomates group bacterium Gr01-1014_5]|nr:MAG: hypothetical protein G01um10145_541 [Microgenomates group bacterium Gr01-1014_5]
MSEGVDNTTPTIQWPHFERVKFTDGHLFVLKSLPPDLSADFQELLLAETPWRKNGIPLNWKNKGGEEISKSTRRVEKFSIGNTEILVKEMAYSTYDVHNEKGEPWYKRRLEANIPLAQIRIVNEASKRYKQAYSEDLPVEQLLAYYTDANSTKNYMIYRYYPTLSNSPRFEMRGTSWEKEYNEIVDKLHEVGVFDTDNFGYIITSEQPKIILVDTERWKISE